MLERRLAAAARPRSPWPTLRGRWKLCRKQTIGRRGHCRAPQRPSRTQVLPTLRRRALQPLRKATAGERFAMLSSFHDDPQLMRTGGVSRRRRR